MYKPFTGQRSDFYNTLINEIGKRWYLDTGVGYDVKEQQEFITKAHERLQKLCFTSYQEVVNKYGSNWCSYLILQVANEIKGEKEREKIAKEREKTSRGLALYELEVKDYIGEVTLEDERRIIDFFYNTIQLPHGYSKTAKSIFKLCEDICEYDSHYQTNIVSDFIEFFSLYRLELPIEDREAHTIIIAGSGSGKSELIKTMLYRDLKNPKISTVLIDPHGQLAPQVMNMKGKDHTKMVYIKPTLSDTQTPILNPFDIQFNNERELQNYLNFLIHTFEQTASVENSEPQKELLEAGINAVFEMKGGLFELFGLFNDNTHIYNEAVQVTRNPIYKNILLYKWKTPQLNATKSAIQRSINGFLKNIDFRDFTTGKSTVKLPYLLNNGYKVIFDLKDLPTPIADAIGRFITAQVTSLALSRNANGYNKPIYFYIDEFSRFMSPSIGNVLTEARKFGLHLVGAIQGIHGDETPQIVNKLLSNTAIKIVGNSNYKNAQAMKNEIGIEGEEIQGLKVGEFYIKTRKKEAYKYKNPSYYIGDRYSVNSREKGEIIGQQLQKYYNTRFNTAQILTSFLPTPSEERTEPNRQQQQSRPKQEQSQRQEPQRPKEQPQTITATQPTPKAQKKPRQDDLSDLNFKTDLSL